MTGMDTGEDPDPRTQAALDLAGTYVFGTEPGRIPAVLFEAYEATTDDRDRARSAPRSRAAGCTPASAHRAVPFAVAAVKHARRPVTTAVLADALDAALATHWGPDELEVRVDLAGKLADVTAHLTDVDARTQAHLWLLTVAAETLDVPELNRQVRALERLGEESRKALFFAASRRLMLDLMRGRTDTAARLVALAAGRRRCRAGRRLAGRVAACARTAPCTAGDRATAASRWPELARTSRSPKGIRELFAEIGLDLARRG